MTSTLRITVLTPSCKNQERYCYFPLNSAFFPIYVLCKLGFNTRANFGVISFFYRLESVCTLHVASNCEPGLASCYAFYFQDFFTNLQHPLAPTMKTKWNKMTCRSQSSMRANLTRPSNLHMHIHRTYPAP